MKKDSNFYEELTLLKAQELISKLMNKQKLKKIDLADLIDRDKSYVTQILSSGRNLTLKTFSNILFALNYEITFSIKKISKNKSIHNNRVLTNARYDSSNKSKTIPLR